MPDKSLSFDYENNFYLTCDSSRIGKLIAHYELYKLISNINGSLVECGVYKGASLARFSILRKIYEQEDIRNTQQATYLMGKVFSDNIIRSIRGMQLCVGNNSVVFDVPDKVKFVIE